MLLNYGHAKIEWQGVEYNLAPTFANIAKIGTPTEIISDFKSFVSTLNYMHKFSIALNVLNACCDKELPESFTGRSMYSERDHKFKYVPPKHGQNVFGDIINLAQHCLHHGICGKVNRDDDGEDSKPLNEFDSYEFIELARVHLSMTRDEAKDLTMTEFVRMMRVKFPEQRDDDKPTRAEEKELLDWYFDKDKAH